MDIAKASRGKLCERCFTQAQMASVYNQAIDDILNAINKVSIKSADLKEVMDLTKEMIKAHKKLAINQHPINKNG